MTRKMKTKHLLLLIVAVVLLLSGTVSLFYSQFIVKEVRVYPMDITVAHRAGLNGDADGLHFGTIPPGSTSKKKIDVRNPFDYPLEAGISLGGELAPWVSVTPHTLILAGGQETTLNVIATIPSQASAGNYSGDMKIVLKRSFP